MPTRRQPPLAMLALLLLLTSPGCIAYPFRSNKAPRTCVPPSMPKELSKVLLPDYIIEPPDLLEIDVIRLVPKNPYRLEALDVVAVATSGVPEEESITGEYTVQPSGVIQLGQKVGPIMAAGRTTTELQQEINALLEQEYNEASSWVTIAQLGALQEVQGEHLVGPDGKINLGTYGRVRVTGLTLEEARAAVETHLSAFLEQPKISVDVLGYNSKVYYVVTQGGGLGDRVNILPSKGNETIIDAIGQFDGFQSSSSTRMWIARPGGNQAGGDQILPIDWLAITQRGDVATNYQLMPGDRLYISEDKLVSLDTRLGKLISPAERLMGFTLLGSQTYRSVSGQNQGFNNINP